MKNVVNIEETAKALNSLGYSIDVTELYVIQISRQDAGIDNRIVKFAKSVIDDFCKVKRSDFLKCLVIKSEIIY